MDVNIKASAHSCRELCPVIDLVIDLGNVVGLPTKDLTTMHVLIYKDNTDTLILAEVIL